MCIRDSRHRRARAADSDTAGRARRHPADLRGRGRAHRVGRLIDRESALRTGRAVQRLEPPFSTAEPGVRARGAHVPASPPPFGARRLSGCSRARASTTRSPEASPPHRPRMGSAQLRLPPLSHRRCRFARWPTG
eukprot:1870437-Prymnesium_polylepis.1